MLTLLAVGEALSIIAATSPECLAMYSGGCLVLAGILAAEWVYVLRPAERVAGLKALGELASSLKLAEA